MLSKMTEDNIAWLSNFASGKKFLQKLESEETKRVYVNRLKKYCDFVRKTPDELIALKLEGLQNPNTEKESQAEDLLEDYLYNTLKDKASVQLAVLTVVKSFYSATRFRALAEDTGSKISALESKHRKPTIDDLVELDDAMTLHRDRAIIWFLESCPVRKGTLGKLNWKDLVPTGDKQVPYIIHVESKRLKGAGKGKFVGTKHIGFLHWYAVQKLERYKQELAEKQIEYNENSPIFMAYQNNQSGQVKGGRLVAFNKMFTEASLFAWKDLNHKRFSPHDMRDILQSVLEKPQIRINPNLIKPLISHKVGGVDGHYSEHEDSEYLEAFKMALPYLIPESIPELKSELVETKAEYAKQQETINMQEAQLSTMQSQQEDQDKIIEGYEAQFQKLLGLTQKVQQKFEEVTEPIGFVGDILIKIGKGEPLTPEEIAKVTENKEKLKRLRDNQPQ